MIQYYTADDFYKVKKLQSKYNDSVEEWEEKNGIKKVRDSVKAYRIKFSALESEYIRECEQITKKYKDLYEERIAKFEPVNPPRRI